MPSKGIKSPEGPAVDSDLWIFCFILLQKNLELPQAEALWVVEGKRFSFQLAKWITVDKKEKGKKISSVAYSVL